MDELNFRSRVVAMYQKYCPEKPLSHVEFLLTKYRGYENELMEVLVQKYGPEPQSTLLQRYEQELGDAVGSQHTATHISSMINSSRGMEESLLFSAKGLSPNRFRNETPVFESDGAHREQVMLLRESDTDRGAVFHQRQDQFRADMSTLNKERQYQTAQALQDVIAVAQDSVQSQEKEIRTLRSDLQAMRTRHDENCFSLQEDIRSAACELTKMRLDLLRLEGLAVAGEAPLSELVSAETDVSQITSDTLHALQSLYIFERVARMHLALHPVTPLRTKLRESDPILSARLDML
jgi:hypothetical protein